MSKLLGGFEMRRILYAISLILLLSLVSCGGGSDSPSPSSNTSSGNGSSGDGDGTTAKPYSELAATSQVMASVNLANNTVQINWKDLFPLGAIYTVEVRNADGTFTTLSSQPSAGTEKLLMWQEVLATSETFQVIASISGRKFTLLSAQGATTVTATVPMSAPAIAASPSHNPLGGTVSLSVSNNFAYPAVIWSVDGTQIGRSTDAGGQIKWDTSQVANGMHLVAADIELSPGSFTHLEAHENIYNSDLSITATVTGTTGTIDVDVRASSRAGVAAVSTTIDGINVGTLATPNACSSQCAGTNDLFRFTVNAVTLGTGTHTALITATDGEGGDKSVTLSIPVSNPLSIYLDTPRDGTFIERTKTLTVSGRMDTNVAGGAIVVGSLGDAPITIRTPTANTFTGTIDLTSIAPGAYPLTVIARDPSTHTVTQQISIVVASSEDTTYSSNFSLGYNGLLLAAQGQKVLFRTPDGSYRIHDFDSGNEVTLQNPVSIPLGNGPWIVSGEYAFSIGKGTDCTYYSCVYQWDMNGSLTNLSNADPYPNPGSTPSFLVFRDGYLVWVKGGAGANRFCLYNPNTGAFMPIDTPSAAVSTISRQYDFFVSNGVVTLYYRASVGTGGTPSFDIFKWSSQTNTTSPLGTIGGAAWSPQTDGERISWEEADHPTLQTFTLWSKAHPDSVPSLVESTISGFNLRDGLFTWVTAKDTTNVQGEPIGVSTGLKVLNSDGTQLTLSSSSDVFFSAIGNGYVLLSQYIPRKTYKWHIGDAQPQLLIDTVPSQLFLSGSNVFFTAGRTQWVFKADLSK